MRAALRGNGGGSRVYTCCVVIRFFVDAAGKVKVFQVSYKRLFVGAAGESKTFTLQSCHKIVKKFQFTFLQKKFTHNLTGVKF